MNSYNLNNISGIASTIFSSVALLIAVILVPLIKALPEETGLPVFITFFPAAIILASLGIILGGSGLTSASKPFHLAGILVGSLALVVNLAAIFLSL